MNQLSSMVKTFVEGQGSMIESLEEMIDRHYQEQVSHIFIFPFARKLSPLKVLLHQAMFFFGKFETQR